MYKHAHINELPELEKKNAVLLDVRTPMEFQEGHLEGAILVDFNSPFFAELVTGLEKDKTYYIYCRSGGRSAGAARIMHQLGFKDLYNMVGGMLEWDGEVLNN